MALRFGTLEGVPPSTLHASFLDAFSDYAVPVTSTLDEMLAMHRRRGVDYSISLGAWDGDRLAGFVFNGAGPRARGDTGPTAYDSGTGVAPTHRGQGLSKELARRSAELLADRGFAEWLLEVLEGNEKAIRAYAATDFKVTRRFACPIGSVEPGAVRSASPLPGDVELVEAERFDPATLADYRDWEPSWQNSDASIARTPETVLTLLARDRASGRVLGGIVSTDKGSVMQLAVAPDLRRRGIGRALVLALAAKTGGAIKYVNVESTDAATLGLLASLGVTPSLGQFEMLLDLRGRQPE